MSATHRRRARSSRPRRRAAALARPTPTGQATPDKRDMTIDGTLFSPALLWVVSLLFALTMLLALRVTPWRRFRDMAHLSVVLGAVVALLVLGGAYSFADLSETVLTFSPSDAHAGGRPERLDSGRVGGVQAAVGLLA